MLNSTNDAAHHILIKFPQHVPKLPSTQTEQNQGTPITPAPYNTTTSTLNHSSCHEAAPVVMFKNCYILIKGSSKHHRILIPLSSPSRSAPHK